MLWIPKYAWNVLDITYIKSATFKNPFMLIFKYPVYYKTFLEYILKTYLSLEISHTFLKCLSLRTKIKI